MQVAEQFCHMLACVNYRACIASGKPSAVAIGDAGVDTAMCVQMGSICLHLSAACSADKRCMTAVIVA